MGYYLYFQFDNKEEEYDIKKVIERFCKAGCKRYRVDFAEIDPVNSYYSNGRLSHQGSTWFLRFNQDNPELIKKGKWISLMPHSNTEIKKIKSGLFFFLNLESSLNYRLYDEQLKLYVTKDDIEKIMSSFEKWIKKDNRYYINLEFDPLIEIYDFERFVDEFCGLGLAKNEYEILQETMKLQSPLLYPIWLDVSEKFIEKGIWASIRMSWGESKESMQKLIGEILQFASQVGCQVTDGETIIPQESIEKVSKSFGKFKTAVSVMLGTIDEEAYVAALSKKETKPKNSGKKIEFEKIPDAILNKLWQISIDTVYNNDELAVRASNILKSNEYEKKYPTLKELALVYNENGNFLSFRNMGKKASESLVETLKYYCDKLKD